MFIVGAQNDKVYEYSLSTGFDLNVTASGNGGNESLTDQQIKMLSVPSTHKFQIQITHLYNL